MGDTSYTVEAILKARDSGFSSAFKKAEQSVTGLTGMAGKVGSVFKSVLGANLVSSALTAGIGAVTSGIGGMVSELNSSQKAWKTFEGNMQAFGKSGAEIAAAKQEMQDFATKTIYSASDMASTYSQLEAVGTKNVGSLVKAFGGLAASAENPSQAMKSLSQQATQMASKPKVAWQDFKIMMEQAPAGMAAVAKEMGMSTDELVAAVQDGKISTEEFFDAMERAGNSDAFQKMATEFKTVDQAIDGLKEGLSNKLMPAFDKLNEFGIKAVNAVSNAIDKINFDKLAKGLGDFLNRIDIEEIVEKVAGVLSTIGGLFKSAFATIGDTGLFQNLLHTFDLLGSVAAQVFGGMVSESNTFSNAMEAVGEVFNLFIFSVQDAITAVGDFISGLQKVGAIDAVVDAFYDLVKAGLDLSEKLSGLIPWEAIGVAIGYVIKFISKVVQAIANLSQMISGDIWRGTVSGVAGAILAFKGFNFLKSFNPFSIFKKKAEESVDGATNGIKKSKSTISQIFNGISNVLKSAGNALKSTFQGLGGALKSTLQGLGKTFEGFGKGVGAAMKGIMQGMRGLNPATLIAFGTSFAIAAVGIGAAIAIIAAGFTLLATQSQGVSEILRAVGDVIVSVGKAIGTVVQMAFQGLADALVTVAPVLPIIASAFTMMSPAITAVGEAIATIIESFSGLAPVITALGDAISQVVSAISSGVAEIITAATPIVEIISNTFTTLVQIVADSIVQIVQALAPFMPAVTEMVVAVAPVLSQIIDAFNNLVDNLGPIIDSITELFGTLGEQISDILEGAQGVIDSFGGAVRNVLDGISGIFDSIGNAALNAGRGVKEMAQGIKILVDMNIVDLGETLFKVASGLGDMAKHSGAMTELGSAMSQVGKGMTSFSTEAEPAAAAMTAFSTGIGPLKETMAQLPQIMTTAATGFQTFAAQAVASLAGLSAINAPIALFKDQISSIGPTLLVAGAGMTLLATQFSVVGVSLGALTAGFTALSAALAMISASMSQVGSSASQIVGQLNGIPGATQAVVSAFNTMSNQVQSAMNRALQAVISVGNRMKAQGRQIGQQTTRNLAQGIRSGAGQVSSSMSSLMQAAVSRAQAGVGAMRNAGAMIGQGLAQGMLSALGAVTAAADALVAQAERAAQAKAKIHSPSRLFRDEVGIFIGQGMAVGIEKSAKFVTKAIDDLVEEASEIDLRLDDLFDNRLSYRANLGEIKGDITHQLVNRREERHFDALSEALDTIQASLGREVVFNINGQEFARVTGRDIASYQANEARINKLLREGKR